MGESILSTDLNVWLNILRENLRIGTRYCTGKGMDCPFHLIIFKQSLQGQLGEKDHPGEKDQGSPFQTQEAVWKDVETERRWTSGK